MCWAETQVKPIEAEDHAIALIKYANGAISQVEVSWNFRGGMDLRDEVSGTEGTIRLDHWLRTGFEVFTTGKTGDYVSEKSESENGWLFPVGDEVNALGYTDMFADMLDSMETKKTPYESFYDGYIVNSIIDACYRSAQTRKWEPVIIDDWRGKEETGAGVELVDYDKDHYLIKKEKMPDGKVKVMLKEKATGKINTEGSLIEHYILLRQPLPSLSVAKNFLFSSHNCLQVEVVAKKAAQKSINRNGFATVSYPR